MLEYMFIQIVFDDGVFRQSEVLRGYVDHQPLRVREAQLELLASN
jgi:hypothetical protein